VAGHSNKGALKLPPSFDKKRGGLLEKAGEQRTAQLLLILAELISNRSLAYRGEATTIVKTHHGAPPPQHLPLPSYTAIAPKMHP
jgi:hypothetical protein